MTNLMEPQTIDVLGGIMSYLSIEIDFARETLLFVHGLGESNLSFLEAFQEPALQSYNLIAPDLLGFGRSSDAVKGGYSFSSQVTRLIQLLEKLGMNKCHLVGHSMGGDIGVKLCLRRPDLIGVFVNIEGDLTSGDRFITKQAMKEIQRKRFQKWFEGKFHRQISNVAKKRASLRRYLFALGQCRLEAFSASVVEIYGLNEEKNKKHSKGKKESRIARQYRSLKMRKIYCWGRDSLSPRSQQYLSNERLQNQAFAGSGHWVMQDRREAFYNFLAGFLAGHHEASS